MCNEETVQDFEGNVYYVNQFVDIPGFEGRYAINIEGQVYSYPNRYNGNKGRIMKYAYDKDGYITYLLKMNSKGYRISRARLLALTFIPNPENYEQVDHIDRNKLNNDLFNLRWISVKENIENRKFERSKGYQKTKYGKYRVLITFNLLRFDFTFWDEEDAIATVSILRYIRDTKPDMLSLITHKKQKSIAKE